MGSFPLSLVETQSFNLTSVLKPRIMFLSLVLMVQIMQISGHECVKCKLIQRDAYFGLDHYRSRWESSKSECEEKCIDTWPHCRGFSYWVSDYDDSLPNCYLCTLDGTEEGAETRGLDSYTCSNLCEYASGGTTPRFVPNASGGRSFDTSNNFGGGGASRCDGSYECRRNGKCCNKNWTGRKWRCPKSC